MRYRHVGSLNGGARGSSLGRRMWNSLPLALRVHMSNPTCRISLAAVTLLFVLTYAFSLSSGASLEGLRYRNDGTQLKLSTWNIAAINNNPFEYWITYDNDVYNNMMLEVQDFINDPGQRDVLVKEVFTPMMFKDLTSLMTSKGWSGVTETAKRWRNDFSQRRIVSGFMKDGDLGKKRLTSMPDRVTNTMNVGGSKYYRPTVINCYNKTFASLDDWWTQWKVFMFDTKIDGKYPSDLLHKIPKAKYDAITVAEEAISIPLQTLAAAIFDAILVHMMMSVERDGWQKLRRDMCASLNLRKNTRILQILEEAYSDQDVIFLQEVAPSFMKQTMASNVISSAYYIITPQIQSKNNQNSVILLNKKLFPDLTVVDLTSELTFDNPKMVAAGDILAVQVGEYLLASFHGDTNGMATIPVVKAVMELKAKHSELSLIFGLDANTYEHAKPGKTQDVLEFAQVYFSLGLTSCWGDKPDPKNHTTCNARTYLQPQLNKAAKLSELSKKGDVNPKDFILFERTKYRVVHTGKDNTGERHYIENMVASDPSSPPYVFPTMEFPSDHGILSTLLESKSDL